MNCDLRDMLNKFGWIEVINVLLAMLPPEALQYTLDKIKEDGKCQSEATDH